MSAHDRSGAPGPRRHDHGDADIITLLFTHMAPAPRPLRDRARRIWNGLVSLWSFWLEEYEIFRAVRALSAMDERTLKDIGIASRAQIESAVRNADQYQRSRRHPARIRQPCDGSEQKPFGRLGGEPTGRFNGRANR